MHSVYSVAIVSVYSVMAYCQRKSSPSYMSLWTCEVICCKREQDLYLVYTQNEGAGIGLSMERDMQNRPQQKH